MKKVILTITLSVIAIAGFLYEPASKTETSTDVAIENAEALAGPTVAMVGCWDSGGCTARDFVSHTHKGWLLIGDRVVAQ